MSVVPVLVGTMGVCVCVYMVALIAVLVMLADGVMAPFGRRLCMFSPVYWLLGPYLTYFCAVQLTHSRIELILPGLMTSLCIR